MKKNCLECGEILVGRIDKKFCCDYCRNTFNNKVNPEMKNMIRNVNNRLKRNYKTLSSLNAIGKTKITRRKLLDHNFDFLHFTSVHRTKKGKTYRFVYNQGYLELENEHYLLIRKEA